MTPVRPVRPPSPTRYSPDSSRPSSAAAGTDQLPVPPASGLPATGQSTGSPLHGWAASGAPPW
ncbi:hypothetical protein [Streptomyces sirii]|uniref:hypothetical protein n=1 Tax=Streptomyces sirii TaxID=3127701 RepID=UPI003D369AF2